MLATAEKINIQESNDQVKLAPQFNTMSHNVLALDDERFKNGANSSRTLIKDWNVLKVKNLDISSGSAK